MFELLRRLLSRDAPASGTLYIQSNTYPNAKLTCANGTVTLTHATAFAAPTPTQPDKSGATPTTLNIPPKYISDLSVLDDTLSFIFHDQKYRFISRAAIPLFQKIRLLVYDPTIHRAENVEYFTYDCTTQTFVRHNETVTAEIFAKSDDESALSGSAGARARSANHQKEEGMLSTIQSNLKNNLKKTLTQAEPPAPTYFLRIWDSDKVLHLEEITSDAQYYVDAATLSFVWSVFLDNRFYTFCLRFPDPLFFNDFHTRYLEGSYRPAGEDRRPVHTLYKGIAEAADAPGEHDWAAYEQAARTDTPRRISSSFIGEEAPKSAGTPADGTAATNKHLILHGAKCFVTRGHSLGVFDLDNDDVHFRAHLRNAVNDPLKLTAQDGANLLVLDRGSRDAIGRLDLQKGAVVERWETGDRMNDYFHTDNTLVGLSDRALFRIDPRAKEAVVERKEYKTKNEFSCGVAVENENGVAVASRKGDLRLYDSIAKRAKSLLPGFGDPIVGIDTSADGSLVLATCKSYILLFKVNPDYSKHSKPELRRLQLRPQHLAHLGAEVSFTPAKFDCGDTVIIASTGRVVVEWVVADVLAGRLYDYGLKILPEQVVDEDFVVDGRDIVVALRNDVRKIASGELKRARQSKSTSENEKD